MGMLQVWCIPFGNWDSVVWSNCAWPWAMAMKLRYIQHNPMLSRGCILVTKTWKWKQATMRCTVWLWMERKKTISHNAINEFNKLKTKQRNDNRRDAQLSVCSVQLIRNTNSFVTLWNDCWPSKPSRLLAYTSVQAAVRINENDLNIELRMRTEEEWKSHIIRKLLGIITSLNLSNQLNFGRKKFLWLTL